MIDPLSRTAHMSRFASRAVAWYSDNARRLPWRGQSNPYTVWVSEIMLQQTRVDTVIPYFERWMRRFPTVRSLAGASERDVLRAWEGLGYYSRALNLRRAARLVQAELAGKLPSDVRSLSQLPGIGRYTAGAIASIAFNSDEPVLDGNIRRVLARVFNIIEPANARAGEKILWEIAAKHLPAGNAASYNQALMDLGATICLPRHPECRRCPLAGACKARKLGLQEQRPVLLPRKPLLHHALAAVVVRRRGRVLLAQRASKGLLGGMWEFPNAAVSSALMRLDRPVKGIATALQQSYGLKLRVGEDLLTIRHSYSHFRVTLRAFDCDLISMSHQRSLRWVSVRELTSYPMGRVDRKIAERLCL